MNPLFSRHDLSLLFHLEQEARASFAELGAPLHLSRATVRNRVQAMEREGIISGYMTVFDISALGQTGYAVYAQFRSAGVAERERIIRYLCQHPSTYWVAKLGGSFDVLFGLQARDVRQFHQHYVEIHRHIGKYLGRSEVSTRIQVTQFPRHYLIGKPRPKIKPRFAAFRSGGEAVLPSGADWKILRALSANARAALDDIAAAAGVTPATVRRRIGELQKSGVIQGYTAVVHPERLGYQLYKLLIRTSSKTTESNDDLFKYASGNSQIVFFSHVVAPWDFEVTVEVLGHEGLQSIIAEFRERFSHIISEIEVVITFDHFVKYRLLVD